MKTKSEKKIQREGDDTFNKLHEDRKAPRILTQAAAGQSLK